MPSNKLQDEILKKLNAFGDSLLDDENSADVRKKSSKRKKKVTGDPDEHTSEGKKKKQKRRKIKTEETDDKTESDDCSRPPHVKGGQRHLDEIREKLGLTDWQLNTSQREIENHLKGNPGSQLNSSSSIKQRPTPEVIVFEDPAKRKEKRLAEASSKIKAGFHREIAMTSEDDGVLFDLKRARHEVQRYGIKGLDKIAKEEAQVQLAIKLGAKPPTKPYVNYKQLMESKKKQKEEVVERSSGKDDNLLMASTSAGKNKKNKRKTNALEGVDGQIGSYRDGTLRISGKELKKIKQK